LSPQDLAGHDFVEELIDAGVICFKIEGRLKSPHYVAAATQAYRDTIDAAIAHRRVTLTDEQKQDLQQTFSRGFTPGFLEGPNHQRLVRGRFPKSRGLCVGRVVGVSRRGVRVELTDYDASILAAGDGVLFDIGRPEEKEPGGRIWRVVEFQASSLKSQVELEFAAGAVDFGAIPVGALVWKTDDPAMKRRLEQSYAGDPIARRTPVWMVAEGEIGGRLRLSVRDPEGNQAAVEWPGPIELARKHALTAEESREQLGRLGDTPFELAEIENRLPANVMVPRSVLNDLRRQVIASLLQKREATREVAVVEPDALDHLRAEIPTYSRLGTQDSALTVLVRTMEQLVAVLPYRPAMVYCDFEDGRRYQDAVPKAKAAGVPIGLATLRILKPGEEGFLKPILHVEPDAVLVRNLGAMLYLKEHAPYLPQVADFSFNVANELTADLLMREGFTRLVPSYDLSWEQFAALVRCSDPNWYECVIHQHMPMFHNEFCTYAAFLSKGKDWRDCGRPCDHHKVDLRDRTGATFPVVADAGCRNTVFNAVPQSAAEYVGRMRELGIRRYRMDLLRETPEQVGSLVEAYQRVIAGTDDGRDTWRTVRALNQLGVTRGTLQLV
jgi:putative protease